MYQICNADGTDETINTTTASGSFTISDCIVGNTTDVVWIGESMPGGINTGGNYDWQHQQAQQWVPEYDYTKYGYTYPDPGSDWGDKLKQAMEKFAKDAQKQIDAGVNKSQKKDKQKKKGEFYVMKRLVQVVVVDPDKRVEDQFSVVHMGEPHVTSLADEDLLLEVDLKAALAEHNMVRKKIEDEDRSDKRNKAVYLKVVKVSDLEVKVITIAKF